jgi:hypothetical protein
VSNSVVVYLRLLTSAQIRADVETYAPFLFHPELGEPLEPREFCENFVEAVDKEAGVFSATIPPTLILLPDPVFVPRIISRHSLR